MEKKEKSFILIVLLTILATVTFDIASDWKEGSSLWHLALEGAMGILALLGIAFLLSDLFKTKHSLETERENFINFKKEAESWRVENSKYLKGLSLAIDQQFEKWQLSASEKEVALLLLKGLGLKEIAEIRKTSEKTARAQSTAVYSKANLTGRAELAAFFLEDLLLPRQD